MEQESGEGPSNLGSAEEMIRKAYLEKENQEDWVIELLSKRYNSKSFLDMIENDPRCEILRDLGFGAKVDDIVPEDKFGKSVRPAGKLTIIDGKKYVGGWQVDELGLYKEPQMDETEEAFDRLKQNWVMENLLGARKIGEKDEDYEQRIEELNQRIRQYHEQEETK